MFGRAYEKSWRLGLALLSIAALTACAPTDGSDGSAGPQGETGQQGRPGVVESIDARSLTATITSAKVGSNGKPVVTFRLTDQDNLSYGKLTLGNVKNAYLRMTIAKQVSPSDGTTPYWQMYLNGSSNSNDSKHGFWPVIADLDGAASDITARSVYQPSQEGTSGFSAGTLTYDASTQEYTYTFNTDIKSITSPIAVTYAASATHRVGMELRNVVNLDGETLGADATYDFVPSGGKANAKEVVITSTCNTCHGKLEAHGEGRFTVSYCVMCHNPTNRDPNSGDFYDLTQGNPLDFKIMVHRLHMGDMLPSQVDGDLEYAIWGYGDSEVNFGHGTFPVMTTSRSTSGTPGTCVAGDEPACGTKVTDELNMHTSARTGSGFFPDCTKCHKEGTGQPDDAANWKDKPTMQACTSCHNNVYFGTDDPSVVSSGNTLATMSGKWYDHTVNTSGNPLTDNSACATCHSSSALTAPTDVAHNYPVKIREAAKVWSFVFDTSSDLTYDTAAKALYVPFYVNKLNPTTGAVSVAKVNFRDTTTNTAFKGSPYPGGLNMKVSWPGYEHANNGQLAASAPASALSLNLVSATLGTGVPGGTTGLQSACNATDPPPCTYIAKITLPDGWDTPWLTSDDEVSIAVFFDGHPGAAIQAGIQSTNNPRWRAVPAQSTIAYYLLDETAGGTVTGTPLDPSDSADADWVRRTVVDTAKCQNCHTTITFHGANRSDNAQVCLACHNPNNTDAGRRPSGGADGKREQAIDFKLMIHALHAGGRRSPDSTVTSTFSGMRDHGILVYGFSGYTDFTSTVFPNRLSNCEVCHKPGAYELPIPSEANPTTFTTIPDTTVDFEAVPHSVSKANINTNGTLTVTGQISATVTKNPGTIPVWVSGSATPTELATATDYLMCNISGGSGTYTFELTDAADTTCASPYTSYTVPGAGTSMTVTPRDLGVDASDDYNLSPTAAVCSACHDTGLTKAHIVTVGLGVLDLTYGEASPTGTTMTDSIYDASVNAGYGEGFELCVLCHGPGKVEDVKKVHRAGVTE